MAGANRLQLDFKLVTMDERAAFLNEYLQQPQFMKKPPTEDELETMGNYLLWGKDPVTGLNAKQAGIVDIETKHGTWDKNSNTESLEGLMESPTFNEASLQTYSAVPIKIKREVFSRKEALALCPDYLRPTFVELFAQIDELELMINYYELRHGKRKEPPREQLLTKFSSERQATLNEETAHWNQYHYLKMRHQLVELRREQYVLRDAFKQPVVVGDGTQSLVTAGDPSFDNEIEVLPLGTKNTTYAAGLIFREWASMCPKNYQEEELEKISDFYWQKKKYTPSSQQMFVDFREAEHVSKIFALFFELDAAADSAEAESTLPALMQTLLFYVEQAELTELQQEILDLKLKKVKNVDIAHTINKKWGKSYTPNYISTIFRQRIIPKINDAAKYHEKIVSNLFFEEEFKTCTGCGRTYLRDADNFTRKARSKDGFTSRCKCCEKEARQDKKNKAE